ncbi:ATP-binding protein [Blautia producta]|uniref:Circadian input-output histidine kinase CikA n=1 Tax=Blautia producta TaxID=33035 RepID=A0A4P6LXE0_9FIRM|nr:ATP-binding protein [Blautia producta]QBE96455.1 Autoinducer 2 sensor kinase/phosphatase LuxQ [Blautia producta]
MPGDNLRNLLDSLSETSIYVIEEKSHRLLYCNRRCRETGRGRAVLGAKCHEIWPELCGNCPVKAMSGGESSHIVCYDPLLKTTMDVTADRINWDGDIPAVVITSTPHTPNFEEKQWIQNIEQMYAQSLVTIFDECIIVNLTTDYYMNCQKDVMWTDIPEQGNFGAENYNYAKKVVHPDDLELFHENFSREAMLRLFGEGKKQISRRMRRLTAEGNYHMVEFTAARVDKLGEKECWCILVFRDIQEEFLQEQQRNLEISQLATAAGFAYQMLISVNLTKKTYHMLEYERYSVARPGDEGDFDELIESEAAGVHPDHREKFLEKFSYYSLVSAFAQGKRIVSMEVPHLGEDGSCHWYFTQVVRVDSPYTDDLVEVTLSRNIDWERRIQQETLEKERRAKQLLEDALQKAEKASQAKSDFLSRMSHDIRTPLNAIVGMTELAQLHLEETERLKDYFTKIQSSGAHLLGLINEVLDVSKIESGTVELEEREFDLNSLVKEVSEIVRISLERKNQTFFAEVEEGTHTQVAGDARRLKQVLVNILENASKYTDKGGRVSLLVREERKEEQRAGTYRFLIRDNGIGMKPEYLEHIFEPFSRAEDSRTSKVTGTGLGMTIVKNIVSMMDGTIEVESEYGKGSEFLVTLCMTKCYGRVSVPSEEKMEDISGFTNLRVLLAEDNELNRQIAVEMLELLGIQAEVVEDGKQAVEAVLTHAPLYYDIVFMDIQMPVKNGYEAAREIRGSGMERISELPIYAMTADAFAEDIKSARLAGMNGHLAKPISIDQLKKALVSCCIWKRKNQWEDTGLR